MLSAFDCFLSRISPISSAMKGGRSLVDGHKNQKLRAFLRPISAESDDSNVGLVGTSTSAAVECKSVPEPLKEVEIIRETLPVLKHNDESDIINKTEKQSVSIQVDAPLIRFIKGKWGLTQKQIEKEAGVTIRFPSAKDGTSIVIEGGSVENVNRASEKITTVLEQAVNSPYLDYSHFVSLPLAFHPKLVEKLHNFQNSVLKEVNMDADALKLMPSTSSGPASAMGVDRAIFIKPQTFHLTVLMLKLWNKDRVATATKILQEISSKVMDALENRPVSVRLTGLECMRGSPAKAQVVYAPVEEVGGDGRLLRACQIIIGAYMEAGLVLQKDFLHSLKLHATLMNTSHRKRQLKTRNDSFDARSVFKKYGAEDWGEYIISEAHLSQRFVFDESGYYHCCCSIPFPGSIQIN